MKTRIKVCGITRVEDLIDIQTQSVDAVGFVLFPKSRRAVNFSTLETLAKYLTPFVTPVLLFVNPTEEEVKKPCKLFRMLFCNSMEKKTPLSAVLSTRALD